jgi:hypothetical protein
MADGCGLNLFGQCGVPLLLASWLSHGYQMVKLYLITLLELQKNSVSRIIACTVLKFILSSFAENECLSLCTTFLTPLVFWISNNISLFQSWHVHHFAACPFERYRTIYHYCLSYASSTIDNTHQPVDFSRFTSLSSEKLDHGPLVLFGQLHHLVHHLQTAL